MTPMTTRRFLPLSTVLAAVLATASAFLACCGYHGTRYAPPVRYLAGLEGARLTDAPSNTESYDRISENPFLAARDNPLSTFSVDVDTASYANVRRFLDEGELPPRDAVRLEELVNYFRYTDPPPPDGEDIAARAEVGPCPWAPEHRLLRIGLRARELPARRAPPPRNLVFLVDVSGSMEGPDRLGLVKQGLVRLVEQLGPRDRISLVVYAGRAGLVLPPTPGVERSRILEALEGLEAGGSTNGGEGIQLAYALAGRAFIPHGVNRVVLATDGDFNVGVSSASELLRLVEEERDRGVFLTVLGVGRGNLRDSMMEKLADRGNGNYAYLDSLEEAEKVLVEDAAGTLITVAKDVKIQVELDAAEVARYRLIGYEDRLLRREQFDDDRADAGDMGAGRTVTALYELEPAEVARGGELGTLSIRYKEPEGRTSRLVSWPLRDAGHALGEASRDFRFAAAVAVFGLALRASPHRGNATFAMARELGGAALTAADPHRRELLALVEKAGALARKRD